MRTKGVLRVSIEEADTLLYSWKENSNQME